MDPETWRMFYSDPGLVREARRAAELRIATRKLREAAIDSWAVPVVEWLNRRLSKN